MHALFEASLDNICWLKYQALILLYLAKNFIYINIIKKKYVLNIASLSPVALLKFNQD